MKKKQLKNLEVVIKLTKLESIAEIPQVEEEGIEKRRERIEEIRVRGWA